MREAVEMISLKDFTRRTIELEQIQSSREYDDSYMIYTIDNEDFVTLEDYEDFLK